MKKILLLVCLLTGVVSVSIGYAQQDSVYVQLLHQAIVLSKPNSIASLQDKIKEQQGRNSANMSEIMEAFMASHPQFLTELMVPTAKQSISEEELRILIERVSAPRFRYLFPPRD